MPLTSIASAMQPAALRVALAAALALSTAAQAQMPEPNRFEEDFDVKPWAEIVVQIPPPPSPENLLPFSAGPIARQSFAIDAKSLAVGTDGVVRYILVAVSPGGARNISYEGIRCQSFEKKVYAFGHPGGTWSRSRRDQWEPIPRAAINYQQAALARDFFCEGQMVSGDAETIVERIRQNRPLNVVPKP